MEIIEKLLLLVREGKKVNTDTRSLREGEIFFALKGDRFNGNDFALEALQQGCVLAVVDEDIAPNNPQVIRVNSVLTTLQELATAYRNSIEGLTVIGITGSNGKTTTKELVHAVLSERYNSFATPGNFNNHIGVPLTLLSLPINTEMAIIELGDNHPGEIEQLCNISKPDCGILTNIGKDHLEGFGTMDANIKAKKELFDYLENNQKLAFVNQSDQHIKELATDLTIQTVSYSYGDLELDSGSLNQHLCYKTTKGDTITTQLMGTYNLHNVIAAFTIGKHFSIDETDIHNAIAAYQPKNNRSQLISTESNTIYMDAYNANPSSVELALESFECMNSTQEKVTILGEMGELGDISENEHTQVVLNCQKKNFSRCIFVGGKYQEVASSSPSTESYPNREALEIELSKNPIRDKFILLKGSRSVGLEKLLQVL